MPNSKTHEYRGHHVTVGVDQTFPLDKFSGNYLVMSLCGSVVCRGKTAIVDSENVAAHLAFSLALEAIDIELRKADY